MVSAFPSPVKRLTTVQTEPASEVRMTPAEGGGPGASSVAPDGSRDVL